MNQVIKTHPKTDKPPLLICHGPVQLTSLNSYKIAFFEISPGRLRKKHMRTANARECDECDICHGGFLAGFAMCKGFQQNSRRLQRAPPNTQPPVPCSTAAGGPWALHAPYGTAETTKLMLFLRKSNLVRFGLFGPSNWTMLWLLWFAGPSGCSQDPFSQSLPLQAKLCLSCFVTLS